MKRQVYNPYLPQGEYIPDGEPRVFGDRLYIFGSHDKFGTYQFCQNDYVSWSAPLSDLSDWTYGGVIYKRTQDPRNADGSHFMEAPDCVCYHGKYYLYYPLSGISSVAVAVADCPEGPFAFYGLVRYPDGTPLGAREGDMWQFDPGVLVDGEDVWLYTGNGPLEKEDARHIGSQVMRLAPDMLTVTQGPNLLIPTVKTSAGTGFEGHEFYEASSMRKIGDKYFFIYSSVLSHELCYAVSDRPDGGFRYGGTLVSNADIGYQGRKDALAPVGNTHGSLCELNGQWYIFYHRQTNSTFFARQGCAERVEIKGDKIGQAQMTSCGLNGGPLRGEGEYPAYIACVVVGAEGKNDYNLTDEMVKEYMHGYHSPLTDGWLEFTKTLPCITQDGQDCETGKGAVQYVRHMLNGSCVGFRFFSFAGDVTVFVRTRGKGGAFSVSETLGGESIGKIKFAPSSDWENSAPARLCVGEGVHALYFTYEGEESDFLSFTLEKTNG